MEQFFTEQVAQYGIWWAYGFLFLSAIVENLFPPVPGDTVTLLGAYFVGRGQLDFIGVLVSTTLGSVVGFMALFMIAYKLEWAWFEKRNWKWMQRSQIEKVESWFQKYGYGIILANRFLSGVRSVISISAGLSKLNIGLVILYATISAAIWNAIIIYAGAFIGESWETILEYIQLYNRIFLSVFGVAIVLYLGYRFLLKKSS